MLDPVDAEHLFHEELGVGDDLHLVRSLGLRRLERLQEARVLSHVVRGFAEVAADLDDLAGVGGDENAVAGGAGIAARRAVDECLDLQDVGLSR